MNDILPETHKTETAKAARSWKIVALGAILLMGILYGVFQALPNHVRGADMSKFKIGALAKLEILPVPPPQPQNVFVGPNGGAARLSDFKGKVILVNLWATWCAPCITEMLMLADLQGDFAGTDFQVIAVSVDRADAAAAAKARLADLSGGKLGFFHDPKMSIVFPMKARGFPTSVLYNRDGAELARLAGEADWSSPDAHALIEAALRK